MKWTRYACACCVLGLITLLAVPAYAVVTFSGLVGANADPFAGPYLEGGFSVSATAGTWSEAHLFGNPVPDIYGSSPTGIVELTRVGNTTFTFTSVDLADAGSSGAAATYQIDGLLANVNVFTTGVAGPLPFVFATIPSPNATQLIDKLRITMFRGGATYNIDNINVQIPEPSAPLAAAAILIAGTRRLRRRA